jgi:hypothetical protein
MPSTIKSSQASKHSNTIAATYKLIQRSFFGLMSALLVTTLLIAMVSQISVSAISQEISEDPVVLAQQYLDKSQNTITFTKTKSITQIQKYIKKNNFEANIYTAYSQVEVGDQFLETPFEFNLNDSFETIVQKYSQSRDKLLQTIKQSKTELVTPETPLELPLGVDMFLNIKEAQLISDTKLESAKTKEENKNVNITKLFFLSKADNQELQNLSKFINNKVISKTAISKVKKLEGLENSNIETSDIENILIKTPTEEEKSKVIAQAKESKEGIIRKANERAMGPKIQAEKNEWLKKDKVNRKLKKSLINKKIKENKESEISIQDVYDLGEEGKDLGLEIEPSDSGSNNLRIKIDINKAKNYIETKEFSFIEGLFNFGSIQVKAFNPEQYGKYINYASPTSPTSHDGRTLDVFGGNVYNGAEVGLWDRHTGSNQKFYLYNDKTIRPEPNQGYCLDMSDYGKVQRGENANGVKVHLWQCNGGENQKWFYDTEGLLRFQGNSSYCLDTWSGNRGQKLMVYICGSVTSTESFRAGDYEMIVYARKNGDISPFGHSFVGFAKYNNNNYIECFTAYTLWNEQDNSNGVGCYDKVNRGWWDQVQVNRWGDFNEGKNLTQDNNNSTYLSYWKKNINPSNYSDAVNGGYQPLISTYTYVSNNCTTYTAWLWNKYTTNWFMYLDNVIPTQLYYRLKGTQFDN